MTYCATIHLISRMASPRIGCDRCTVTGCEPSKGTPGQPRTGTVRSGRRQPQRVVAYNFRRARELRGWTQEEVAARLEPFLGSGCAKPGVRDRRRVHRGPPREFDAQELLASACGFDFR